MSRSGRVEQSIELLCNKGCRAVWGIIDTLEQGGVLEETRHLSGEETARVLVELKQIMAVYKGNCSPD